MKTINIFVNSFPKISETFIYNKVKSLLENDFRINVITTRIESSSDDFYQSLSHFENFNIVEAPINGAFNLSTLLKAIFSGKFWSTLIEKKFDFRSSYKEYLQKKTLKMFNPDIIHFEFSGIGFQYLPYLDDIEGVKKVSSFRGAAEKIKPLIDAKRFNEFPNFLKSLDAYHCVSNNMVDELEKFDIDRGKAFVNYPSIDSEKFEYSLEYSFNPNEQVKIISVGRLHWKKGIDIALLALSKLKKQGHFFKYYLVGDGFEFEKLKFMSKNLNLENEVVFLGYKSSVEVSQLLKESDLFLLPSYSEGLSNSALEAMCCGIPVVSSRAGGMNEAIDDDQNGFLFDLGDVDGLYLKLKAIFENTYDLEATRMNAHNTVKERFELKIQSEKFKQFYLDM